MKKIAGFLAIVFLAGTLSVTAQTQPKPATKQAEKMECGKNCKMSYCSDKSKTAEKSSKAPVKKN